jgi:hypothetical protein
MSLFDGLTSGTGPLWQSDCFGTLSLAMTISGIFYLQVICGFRWFYLWEKLRVIVERDHYPTRDIFTDLYYPIIDTPVGKQEIFYFGGGERI